MKLFCWIFGHKVTSGIVKVRSVYSFHEGCAMPDHGEAEICTRCRKILSEITWIG